MAEKAAAAIRSGKYGAMILNFANCDMVGHTGVLEAAEKAVAAVEACLKIVLDAIREVGGMAIVTADHGNADKMIAEDGSPFTAHTTNPVPVILVDDKKEYGKLRDGGRLSDLAPPMLKMMELPVPEEMTGKALF